MIQYPDLDKPASNYNYPPPDENLQQIYVGQSIQGTQWQNNQINMVQYGNIPQYIPAIPNTQYPSSLQYRSFGELDKENLPPYSLNVRCPECAGMIQTKLTYVSGCLSFSLCLTMCVFGLFCGCCLIPFCMNCCKRQVHQCPLCEKVLGDVK
ncbi:unnamed protein product [Paramecium pentaurelia]|uniref:LITAF domain-containing protein n=1 Tax=Paramecium pentaurelia TaxID=43138 RepID=A0A8S1TTB9_9CILI|nr:unnamed protein product [Paramecium pentaurelia]